MERCSATFIMTAMQKTRLYFYHWSNWEKFTSSIVHTIDVVGETRLYQFARANKTPQIEQLE